ncbi:MAG TPA: ATP-grasp domain-containing protein [Candidatus Dormibacteraeota bacterium]|nr:ATP-grasp domain-containing protein [Candidatus Dormibacteraeota bacterium]
MRTVRVLFLGASRLVGLMRRFRAAAAAESVAIDLASIEDESPWHAIDAAGTCRVVHGPAFDSPEFDPFVLRLVEEGPVDAVIPVIDPAVQAVARLSEALQRAGALPIVSRAELCQQVYDKAEAVRFFRSHGVAIPDGPAFPRLAKPRFGSSSRDHVVFRDQDELTFWSARNRARDYVIQPFLQGTEYSVDAYVTRDGRLQGAVARVRVVVSGGEVMVTRTERDEAVLDVARRTAAIPGWYGPLNIQVMKTAAGPFLLEVNPRFSSGVICAIEAGLDGPRFILRERLGRSLPAGPIEWRSGLCMTRSREDHFVWLS